MRRRVGLWTAVVVALLLPATGTVPVRPPDPSDPPRVIYVYDEAGRLRAVTDPSTDTAVYRYDPVGNIQAIERHSSAELSVIEVTPRRAEAGAEVLVQGTGFATDPDDNTVRFGDAEAEVTGGTAFELTAIVPEGARSGRVEVSRDDRTARSAADVEIEPDRSPVIGGLSSRVVGAGETLTIDGENFAEDPLLNAVVLDGATYASVEEASSSELTVRVPPTATPGRVSVGTADGVARSGRELFVVPEPYAADDVEATRRTELGERTTVSIERGGGVGLVAFRGRRGQHIGVDLSANRFDECSLTFGLVAPGGLHLLDPDDADVTSSCEGRFPPVLQALPTTGTHTLVLALTDEADGGSVDLTIRELSSQQAERQAAEAADDDADTDTDELGPGQTDADVEAAPGTNGDRSEPEPRPETGTAPGAGPDAESGSTGDATSTSGRDGRPADDSAGAGSDADAGHGRSTDGDQGAAGEADGSPGKRDDPADDSASDPDPWAKATPNPVAQPDGPWAGHPTYPVDLATGAFVTATSDLVVDDVLPLTLARSYQRPPFGVGEWTFGKGSWLEFDVALRVGYGRRIADLVFPNGLTLPYDRTTEGFDEASAVFAHTATPTIFHGSQVAWNGAGWDLTLTDGTTLVFGTENQAPLRAVRDPNGNQIVVARAANDAGRPTGPVTALYSPSGRWVAFEYDDQDRIVEATDHLGRRVSYAYDTAGRLARARYPGGDELRYGYDPDHRLTTITGPGGRRIVANEYDDEGRVVRQVQADGSAFTFRYTLDASGAVVQTDMTDPAGVVRRVRFAGGYWTSDTTAVGTPQQQTVEAERQAGTRLITAIVDPAGRRTTYEYDDLGYPTSVTARAGTDHAVTTTVDYEDRFHQVARVTDPLGRTARYRYDRRGNLVRQTDPSGAETRYAYDSRGRLTEVTDPLGHTTELSYELLHRVTATDPLGRSRTELRDAGGRLAVLTDPSGSQTRLAYDEAGRLTGVTGPGGAGTTYRYDALGQVVAITDANGNATSYAYDALGRVTTRTDPLGATDRYRYDAAGNLVSHVDRRGVEARFTYDPLGRQTAAAFGVRPDGAGAESTVRYTYDDAGRLVRIDDSAYGTVDLEYDELDRLVGETTPDGAVTYGYDEAGRRTAMALEGGPETAYGYDAAGRLTSIEQGDAEVGISWDQAGRVDALRLPNGVVADHEYDGAGGLTGIAYSSGGGGEGRALGGLGYRYNSRGQRVGVTGDLAATAVPEAVDAARHGAGNRLTGWAADELTYDAAGNLVDDGTNTYRWDARGQLVEVSGPVPASFTYDPFGRRATKTVDGVATTYRYDGVNVVQQATGGGDPTTYLTGLGPDEVLARTGPDGDVTSYLADGLGSTIGLVGRDGDDGDDGEIATRYTHGPFGTTETQGADDPNPFGFTGRELDETGLYYYRARYYHPRLGRFLSEDPLGHSAGDPNHYAYVANDPANLTDPSGQCLGSALLLISQSFDLLDEMLDLLDQARAGAITTDELLAGLDDINRRNHENLNRFFILCGAEGLVLSALTTFATTAPRTFLTSRAASFGRVGGPSRVGSSTELVPYDAGWASRQLLGQNLPGSTGYAVTPAGRSISAHAAERLALGGGGRPANVPLSYVDEILNTGSALRYDPIRQSIQVRATQLPGRPFVVVDSPTGQHVVTAMVPKL